MTAALLVSIAPVLHVIIYIHLKTSRPKRVRLLLLTAEGLFRSVVEGALQKSGDSKTKKFFFFFIIKASLIKCN